MLYLGIICDDITPSDTPFLLFATLALAAITEPTPITKFAAVACGVATFACAAYTVGCAVAAIFFWWLM